MENGTIALRRNNQIPQQLKSSPFVKPQAYKSTTNLGNRKATKLKISLTISLF
jgi:hypothetical protein